MGRLGLSPGTSGNLSVRLPREGILVTPSGIEYERLREQDLVCVSWDGAWTGPVPPSSETPLHLAVYRQVEDAGAVLHAHSPACTTLACLERAIPAIHYMVAVAGGSDIPCLPYAPFGSEELARLVARGLRRRRACLLAHHGLVCRDTDLERVLLLAVEVESLAGVYLRMLQCTSEVPLLGRDAMADALERMEAYRRRAER